MVAVDKGWYKGGREGCIGGGGGGLAGGGRNYDRVSLLVESALLLLCNDLGIPLGGVMP